MADNEQKTNKNGRPVLVFRKEHLEQASQYGQTASDWVGYVKDTGDVFKAENFNFKWGIIHSKNAPMLSRERFKKVTEIKMYSRNSETGRIFTGNPHTKVFNTKKVLNNVDKVGSTLGNLGDGGEILLAVTERDSKALATKTSTLVLSKVGEASGERAAVHVAGKCTKIAAKRLDPRKIAIAGVACSIAAGTVLKYGNKELGNKLGEKVGDSNVAIQVSQGLLNGLDAVNKMEDQAEERRKQKAINNDPMLEWQIEASD